MKFCKVAKHGAILLFEVKIRRFDRERPHYSLE